MRGWICVCSWVVELVLVALELALVEGVEHGETVDFHGISEEVRGNQVGNGGRDTHPESQGLVWTYKEDVRKILRDSESASLICLGAYRDLLWAGGQQWRRSRLGRRNSSYRKRWSSAKGRYYRQCAVCWHAWCVSTRSLGKPFLFFSFNYNNYLNGTG